MMNVAVGYTDTAEMACIWLGLRNASNSFSTVFFCLFIERFRMSRSAAAFTENSGLLFFSV